MMTLIKSISIAVVGILLLLSCDNQSGTTRTETTVLETDTVGAEVTYDVNEKTVESVDTVGATTEYQVEKRVRERTVKVDTVTREITRTDSTDYQEGDYEVVDESVEQETATEDVEIDS